MTPQSTLITNALASLGIEQLNAMQQAAIEAAAKGQDLILLSPTGSGKTLAFLLPLLERLSTTATHPQALILVPSRELALQIEQVFKQMNTSWRCCCCYGGHPIGEEKRSLENNPPALIVGTPGRIGDHLAKGNFDAKTLHTLVIDEFDKSLEFGFHDEMMTILDQLTGLKQRILISATDAEEIPHFTGVKRNIKLNYLPEEGEQPVSRLSLKRVNSPARDKVETLFQLLCTLGSSSTIVFCNHRDAVDRVCTHLQEHGLPCAAFHGGMEQPERERALYKYRNGSCHVLVSTDLASRGLDIPHVAQIIHYHLPPNEEPFTHRNGRTARWEATGDSYVLVCEDDKLPTYLPTEIPLHSLPAQIPPPSRPLWSTLYIGKGKKEKMSRMDVAGFFYKQGGLTRDDLGQIDVRDHYTFVAVRRTKVRALLAQIKGLKIKGMRTIIAVAK